MMPTLMMTLRSTNQIHGNGLHQGMTQHPPVTVDASGLKTTPPAKSSPALHDTSSSLPRLHPLSPHHLKPQFTWVPALRSDMSSLSIFRVATRAVRPASFVRAPIVRSRVQTPVTLAAARARNFGTTPKRLSGHEDETYEEFSARYDCSREPLAWLEVGG